MIETCFSSKEVDILLFAEGTYPFVRGGVSSWIFQLIENLPQYKFGVIFLGAVEGLYKEFLYPIPDNLVHLQIVYLFFVEEREKGIPLKLDSRQEELDQIKEMHQTFKQSHGCPKDLCEQLPNISHLLAEDSFNLEHFLRSEESWEYIKEQYTSYSTTSSFIDYFWNVRNMHMPLWQMAKMVEKVPKTKVLHSISTGYAGFLATMIHQRYGWPMILCEHGLYSKERSIELLQTTMFPRVDKLISNTKNFSYQHNVWLNFFDSLARSCYHYASLIISLYDNARLQQQSAGADEAKTLVIPNGVDIKKFAAIRRPANAEIPKIVCFVGRVVRIKDVKTFIRSIAIMIEMDPGIKAWIRNIGNEDPEYAQECLDYISLMGLKDHIHFIEEGDMLYILANAGLIVLSSISEGMPLVLLESLAAGIPVIATSVGACKELIEGRDEEDRALGKCGAVISITNASMLAEEAVKLLNNRALWQQAHKVCITRVEKYYTQEKMVNSYNDIYQKALS
ncbi:Spore coat protein SA [Legionella massiliensis]|uniref:Spore coat protein SA n=1 Tax=Legionella massiliensis TaxID=1034943 RepID=A0A078KUD5_9GAMM|nr:GT4 family glycosyltransferase PelF [Legionella massiliensis]CDZ78060.1 Spore coat protein SA [Legionella massiliensis]CEE13798.1 D-inositol 3-phosphate glycosyltransferase [Legionella massiliensis]